MQKLTKFGQKLDKKLKNFEKIKKFGAKHAAYNLQETIKNFSENERFRKKDQIRLGQEFYYSIEAVISHMYIKEFFFSKKKLKIFLRLFA